MGFVGEELARGNDLDKLLNLKLAAVVIEPRVYPSAALSHNSILCCKHQVFTVYNLPQVLDVLEEYPCFQEK